MALNNCTINSATTSTTQGQQIGSLANVILTITPDHGFVLKAQDFTNNTGSLAGITSITLSDNGTAYTDDNTIKVTVDLDNTFSPSSDTDLVIDIDGNAILKKLVPQTISGTFDTVVANATPASQTGVAYSVFGTPGSIVSLFNKTFTAASGKFFETPPSYVLSTGVADNYIVTAVDTFSNDVFLTARAFTVKGKVPSISVSGDNIDFAANASGTIVAASTGNITAFRILTTAMTYDRARRKLVIYGDVGAQFQLSMVNEDSLAYNFSTSSFTSGATFSGTIPASGSLLFEINIPAVTDDDQYNFTLSTANFNSSQLTSNIDANGDQIALFSIQQLGNVQYIVSTDAAADSRSYTSNPLVTHLGSPFIESSTQTTVTSTLVLTDNVNIVLSRLPLLSDITGTRTDSATATDSSIDLVSITATPSTLNASGNNSISFAIVSNIDYFGTQTATHVLDVGAFIAAEGSGGGGARLYTPAVTGAGGGLILGAVRGNYGTNFQTKSVNIGTASGTSITGGTGVIFGNFYGNSFSQITLAITATNASAFNTNSGLTISKTSLVGQAPAQDLHYNWTATTDEVIDGSSDMTFTVAVSLANEP